MVLQGDVAARSSRDVLGDPARLLAVRRLAIESRADAAFDRIAALVERLVDVPVALVTVIDADRQFVPGQVGLPEPLAESREMPLSHSFSRHVVEGGRPLTIPDVRCDERTRDNLSIRDLGAVAFAGVPLTDPDGLVVGTLAVMDREPRQWTPSEIALLTDLAEVCSSEVGLRIARAIAEEARGSAEEARRTAEESRFSAEAAKRAAEEARHTAEENRRNAEAAKSAADQARRAAEENRRNAEAAKSAADQARRTAEENRRNAEAAKNAADQARHTAEENRRNAEAAKSAADQARRAAEENRRNAEIARRAAEQSRRGADEARRHAEAAHDQLSLLGELTEALAATMDLDEALGRLGQMVAGRLADWCFVTLADRPDAVRHVSAAHRDPARAVEAARLADLAGSAPDALHSMIVAMRRAGRLVRKDDPDPAVLRARPGLAGVAEIAERFGVGSYLLAPITTPVSGRTVGVVVLVNEPGRPAFGPAQERTAAEVGRRAGLAVDNSRLYGRQRHVAEVLQHSMLTELPRIPGIELHARYLPAEAGAAVGGDWYDAFAQPDGSVMLAVGDVSGHDIEAAATMGQVRNLVRGDAYGRDDAPGTLLTQLDRALHGLQVPAAATAVLARLWRDGDDYAVTFANAGHPPPVLLRPDGEVEVWWETPEPLLGLIPREGRATHRRRVAAGSTLLLYTDGLVEHPARMIDEGIARVRAVLVDGGGLPGDELCSRLIDSADRRADDIVLLLIRLG